MRWRHRIRISSGILSKQRIIFIWPIQHWWTNMFRNSFWSIDRNNYICTVVQLFSVQRTHSIWLVKLCSKWNLRLDTRRMKNLFIDWMRMSGKYFQKLFMNKENYLFSMNIDLFDSMVKPSKHFQWQLSVETEKTKRNCDNASSSTQRVRSM